MINELIEQIGGRERLEYILIHEVRFSHDTIIMARALLAVLDAKPVGKFVNCGGIWYETDAHDGTPLYTVEPAASASGGK